MNKTLKDKTVGILLTVNVFYHFGTSNTKIRLNKEVFQGHIFTIK